MIGQNFGNYKITHKLGAGGQGTVYKAIDQKLGRTVVLKILPPELTVKHTNLKRFEREARLASALDHPNICTIFDMDEAEGLHFIAMQYVEGKTVRQLCNGRPLELDSALRIAIQTADALSVAHTRGIMHRDIKSGNVMVTDAGQVKILDFGLAKLLDDETNPGGIHQTDLTEVGVPYGTATYAAPEQARGDKVDERADIFSTGVLLYEMLTGTWPFRGKSAVDVRHAVIHDQPLPLSQSRPGETPARLQKILDKAMQKDPRDRYQKVGELRDELRKVLHDLSTGVPMDIAAAPKQLGGSTPVGRAMRWLRKLSTGKDAHTSAPQFTSRPNTDAGERSLTTTVADREKKSLAVLPFKNLNNDAAASFYEFALADAVITELARIRSLVVRPSSVMSKYQGQVVDPADVGRELNVDAVLSAGFLAVGARFRVNAQLLEVKTGEIIWSDRIDASAADIITVQDEITKRIVDGLRLELSPDEQAGLAQPKTVNAEAYEEYLRGRDRFARFIFRTVAADDCDAAMAHFSRAIELDPEFGLAYDGLGACHVNRVFKGLGGSEDYEKAEGAFTRALALDANMIEARMLMIFCYLWRGQKARAREEVARARREAPNEAVVHFVKATLHRLDGDYDRALRSYDRLVHLDPAAFVVVSYNRALIFLYRGKGEDAIRELDRAATVEPNNPLLRSIRAIAQYYSGDVEGAANVLREVLAQNPNLHGVRPFLAMFLSKQGNHAAAHAELTDAVKRTAAVDPDIGYAVASVYALEGDRDSAFEWLNRSAAMGNENKPLFEHDPNLAALRSDPRWDELIKKITRV